MQGSRGWLEVSIIAAVVSCCAGLVYGTWVNAQISVPELEALLADNQVEFILVSHGDPCIEFKIRGQNNKEKTYLVKAEDRETLIRRTCSKSINIMTKERPL